ncbi:MAG TPA: hypothetical protein VHS05_31945 [Pyrinomonadaceae bacterium]|jgi:hypothetical protein|nr:hypothetical protein [Pyrinomonadaceae bacterium]
MTRNQKIALGCGGAGCLGLIVVAIAGTLIYLFALPAAKSRNYNFNVNTNSNSNTNATSEVPSNINASSNSSNSSSSDDASSLSDDDKHKLYYAAGMTGEGEVVRRVSVKLGLTDEDFTPGANYEKFVQEHVGWVMRNGDFIQTVNTPAKARAYVNEHFPE